MCRLHVHIAMHSSLAQGNNVVNVKITFDELLADSAHASVHLVDDSRVN